MDDQEHLARLARMIDEVVLPGADRYTLAEAAGRAGVAPEDARRLWRALGFADPGPQDRIGGDRDVLALQAALDSTDSDEGIETLIRQTRVMSAALARVADLWVDQIRLALDADEPWRIDESVAAFEDQERFGWLIDYIHRRLFAASLRRELADRSTGATTERTVGFADLVGYTRLTERLGPLELSELIGTFEGLAHDAVTGAGGRVVKTIGDEVMFSTDDPAAALAAVRPLVAEAVSAGLPPLRVGLDHGPVVWFEGDLFGPTVNRAARLVAEAEPSTVAVGPAVAGALPDEAWRDAGPRPLKGVGAVEVRLLRLTAADPSP